jgi:hypothetical protein
MHAELRTHRALRGFRSPLPWGVLLAVLLAAGSAQACALDSRPSLTANGALPILNSQVPLTSGQLMAYTPFVFRRPFAVGARISFEENRADVAKSLVPAAMKRPWRWHFGDGKTAFGWTVTHVYTRAAVLNISVDAYDPGTKQWYQFDLVRMSVVPRTSSN